MSSSGVVVGAGWHDVCLRWDITTPQRIIARLEALPGQGSLLRGRKLFAERDRFGKWQHLLGRHQLVSHAVDVPAKGLVRRLEVQTHLGDEGEDDPCPVAEFPERWARLQEFMAMIGVLPVEEPAYVRVDPAVDVVYDDPLEGQRGLEGLRSARWPYGWYAQYEGPPPYTTVSIKSGTRIVGRAYCRSSKLRNGGPRWGKIRFEREQRFEWKDRRPVAELARVETAATFWGGVFGAGAVSGQVTRIPREVQTLKLVERVQLGEISATVYEQLTGFLDAERLGVTNRIYKPETARRRRRKLAKSLGIGIADVEVEPLDVALDDLLDVPRSAWTA